MNHRITEVNTGFALTAWQSVSNINTVSPVSLIYKEYTEM